MAVPVSDPDGTYIFYNYGWTIPRRGRTFTWSNATLDLNDTRSADLEGPLSSTNLARFQTAFSRWPAVTNVFFMEVSDSVNVDIRVGEIVTPVSFLGNAGVYTAGGSQVLTGNRSGWVNGRIAMNSSHSQIANNETNYIDTAAHEIGHILGLGHPSSGVQLMTPSYLGSQGQIQDGDEAGIDLLFPSGVGDDTRATANDRGDLTNTPSTTRTGNIIGGSNNPDYHEFTLSSEKSVELTLSGLGDNLDLYLESPSGSEINSSELPAAFSENFTESLDAGTYYIRVDVGDASSAVSDTISDYSLLIEVSDSSPPIGPTTSSLSAPTSVSAADGQERSVLSWGAPTDIGLGVTEYQYQLDGAGDWESAGTGTSYTVSNLSVGSHTFKLRAVDSGGYGPESASVSATVTEDTSAYSVVVAYSDLTVTEDLIELFGTDVSPRPFLPGDFFDDGTGRYIVRLKLDGFAGENDVTLRFSTDPDHSGTDVGDELSSAFEASGTITFSASGAGSFVITGIGDSTEPYEFNVSNHADLLTFLTAYDNAQGPLTIRFQNPNAPPTVSIETSAQDVNGDETLQLQATSADSDGTIASRLWTVTGGTFNNSGIEDAIWTAPASQTTDQIYTLTLRVTDDGGATASALVLITVRSISTSLTAPDRPAAPTVSALNTTSLEVIGIAPDDGNDPPLTYQFRYRQVGTTTWIDL